MMTEDQRLTIAIRLSDALGLVIPVVLVLLAVYRYLHRDYKHALFLLGLATGNVSFTLYLQRRAERQRRAFQAKLEALVREGLLPPSSLP